MSDGTGPISVRESLQAASAELSGAPAPEPAVQAAPEPAVPADPGAAAEIAAAAEAKAPPEGRDEKGRFAPKEPKAEPSAAAPAAQPTTETAPPADKEPPETEAIRVPPSLSAAVKAQWNELPPEVRKDIARLEETVQTAKAEWGKKGERLNRYDEIMAPRSEKLTLQGIDEFTAIKTLFAASDFLERDPVGGLRYLAQSYSVTRDQLAQAFGLGQASAPQAGQEGQPAPTAAPDLSAALKPFVDRVQTLEQRLQAQAQRTESEQLASAQQTVQAFASDPANLYFENVRPKVAKLIETGQATGLKDAYEMAIWADPEIRPLLVKAQLAEAAKSAAPAAAAKAKQAAQSSGSVTGAPSAGAVAPAGPPGSVRDSIMAARQELGAV